MIVSSKPSHSVQPISLSQPISSETAEATNPPNQITTPEKDLTRASESPSVFRDPSLSVEENNDLNKLSARSRQRYLKNLHILNEDSLFDEEMSESVAHVDYLSEGDNGDEGGINSFHPDESYYREAMQNEPLKIGAISSPEKEEVSSVEQTIESDAIPMYDDSLE